MNVWIHSESSPIFADSLDIEAVLRDSVSLTYSNVPHTKIELVVRTAFSIEFCVWNAVDIISNVRFKAQYLHTEKEHL